MSMKKKRRVVKPIPVQKEKKKLKARVVDLLELPKEIVLNLPLISMMGNEELHIENYKGMIEYSEEKIRIHTAIGIVKIEGRGLFLKAITTEHITIHGVIVKIEFLV